MALALPAHPTTSRDARWRSVRIRRSLIDLDDLIGRRARVYFRADRRVRARRRPDRCLAGRGVRQHVLRGEHAHVHVVQPRRAATRRRRRQPCRRTTSSLATKGETIEDTAITLGAMGVSVLVVRHPASPVFRSGRACVRRPRRSTPATAPTRTRRRRCSISTR